MVAWANKRNAATSAILIHPPCDFTPAHIRATGVALSFNPAGHENWFYWSLAGMIARSLIVYMTMRDTGRESAIKRPD